ncbi:MAG: 2-phospho-L-lactate guanylyltransferase [Rhodobacteraceae bacterium]|nr:2-phospho-L-lactate guanylyltransferase [Paracoccaceae bacterium]
MTPNHWAVVPIKSFGSAKSRLSALLTGKQREVFSQAMLFDVLNALSKASRLGGVMVVTNEPGAISLSQQFGFQVLADKSTSGPTAAITAAVAELKTHGCDGVLALMGDLPLITSADIERLLTAHQGDCAVTLAPSSNRLGTNAAFCTPPGIIPLTFNGRGLADHLAAARLAGADTHVLDMPSVALDLDQPEDIASLLDTRSDCKTRAFILELVNSGQIPRIPQHQKTG